MSRLAQSDDRSFNALTLKRLLSVVKAEKGLSFLSNRRPFSLLRVVCVLTVLGLSFGIASWWGLVSAVNENLDPRYGTGGRNITDFNSNIHSLEAIAIQPDGRIIAAGRADGNGTSRFALVRYNTNGTLDVSFGNGGKVVTRLSESDQAVAMRLQTDGKIVVVGNSYSSGYKFGLARYNSDGTLDTTFGTGGIVVSDVGGDSFATAMAIQTDGSIVISGFTYSPSPEDFILARYTSNGTLDTSFDTDGKVTTDFGGFDRAESVTIQTDGRIVAAGHSYISNSDFALARYNPNGSLDASFDTDGKLTTNFGTDAAAQAVTLQPNGRIIAAGSGGGFALARYNTNGTLDTSFDTDGKVITSVSGLSSAEAVTTDSNGKIVAAGQGFNADADFASARYNADGSLDTTFDVDGIATTDLGAIDDGARSIAIQSNGMIVVGGNTSNLVSYVNFALARYNTVGSLDTNFDFDGKVITDSFGSNAATAMAIQADTKVVAAGWVTFGTDTDFAVARYDVDGAFGALDGLLDIEFGNDGRVTTDFGNYDRADAVAIQPDGKIVAAGRTVIGTNSNFALARYNSDGTLDTTFDADGKVVTDFGADDLATAVAVQSDGKIVAVGFSITGSNGDVVLARYNADGSLDPTFDADGKVTTDFGGDDAASGAVIQSDGKIVVAGRTNAVANNSFALARYNTNGTLDTSFDTDGKVITDFGGVDAATSVALQPDGKIVAAGWVTPPGSNRNFALARYNSNGSLDATFDTDGKVTTDFSGQDDEARSVAFRPGGRIIAAGIALQDTGSGPNNNYATARYNLDGTLDPTFGVNGKVTTDFNQQNDEANAVLSLPNGKTLAGGKSGGTFAFARYIVPLTISGRAKNFNGIGLQGVKITLIGGSPFNTEVFTGPNGEYTITVAEGGPYAVFPTRVGVTDWTPSILNFSNLTQNITGADFIPITPAFNVVGKLENLTPANINDFNVTVGGVGLTPRNCGRFVNDTTQEVFYQCIGLNISTNYDVKVTSSVFNFTPTQHDFHPIFNHWTPGPETNFAAMASNPLPTITTLSPSTVNVGGATFPLVIDGTGFISSSVVQFNGTDHTPSSFTSTQMTVQISASEIQTAGVYPVTVVNSPPGGGTSVPVNFTVNNLLPTLTTLNPTSVAAGGGNFTLTVDGTSFVSDSKVWWNNTMKATSYVSPTRLTALIEAADITNVGTATIRVENPMPGGGMSNSQNFTIRAARAMVSDFNGDRRSDVAVFRPSSGYWYWLASPNGVFNSRQFGATGDRIAPADFDGDGKTDHVVFRPSTTYWHLFNSQNQDYSFMQFGVAEDLPVPADYDGDGKADLAVFRPSVGTFYILQSTNMQMRTQQWGQNGDVPVPSDYDGDGKADVAIFRPSAGGFYVLRSSNNSFYGQQWGTNGDKPTPGDYDGDGKSDLAVFRPSTGAWYILRSTDNGVIGLGWGVNGDRPSSGDYDGDGKWDVAVFRPSSGVFYIYQSTTNTLRAEPFGTNGDIPVASAYVP